MAPFADYAGSCSQKYLSCIAGVGTITAWHIPSGKRLTVVLDAFDFYAPKRFIYEGFRKFWEIPKLHFLMTVTMLATRAD